MINTNGFIEKWLKATDDLHVLEKELTDLLTELEPIYEELNALRAKYAVAEKEVKKVSLGTQIRDAKNFKEYYYFRSIIDGIYNLLKTYGWKYQYKLFNHLRNFGIKCIFCEYSFEEYYIDEICDLTPSTIFSHEYHDIDEEWLVYGEIDSCDEIKLSLDLDIEKVLNKTEDLLKSFVAFDVQKEEDEEYREYLRLKEKFGDKNVD